MFDPLILSLLPTALSLCRMLIDRNKRYFFSFLLLLLDSLCSCADDFL